MTVTRSKKTNITDVITGVTLNFASDAEQVGVDSGKNDLSKCTEKRRFSQK